MMCFYLMQNCPVQINCIWYYSDIYNNIYLTYILDKARDVYIATNFRP